jgi:DNA uptake protein ComE-like DNA-binding protein
MKKYLVLSTFAIAMSVGCSTQRANESAADNRQSAAQQEPAPADTRTEEQRRADEQRAAKSTGEKIGEKAREAEIATRDERAKIKEGAADAAQTIKKGAKVAAEDIKAAAAGAREGWNRTAEGGAINVNTASQAELEAAGLSKAEAQSVISHRPYRAKEDLKAVLTANGYEKISGRAVVK